MPNMQYSEFVELYEEISKTTKRLEKTEIIAKFLKKLIIHDNSKYIYLLKGKVVPDYDSREIGISRQITIKAISKSFGIKEEEIEKRFRKVGDLGDITEELAKIKKQRTLFSKKLTVEKVFSNLLKIMEIEGKGAVDKKIGLISELLGSASEKEAKYIVRTLLADLRIGIADGVIRDSIAEAFFPEEKKEIAEKVESAYSLSNDFAKVLVSCSKGKRELEKVDIVPGKPINLMLAVKVADIEEAFEVCGKPAAIEHKYDGFRMLISKEGKEIKLFTRRLENVTAQFPDVVEAVRKSVKGESCMLDSEVVGFDPYTKVYKPFEAISQRIKRKYEIEKLIKQLPVEVNVFDIVYYNGKSLLNLPFKERRKIIEKIISPLKSKIRIAEQIITSDEKEALDFYKEALKLGEEGIMVKNIEAPYQSGRRVGYMVKLKPSIKDLDLVIVGAEYGSGKRAGWLTSYILACRSEDEFLEIGKVSSGLKELSTADRRSAVPKTSNEEEEVLVEEGTSYDEMSELLKPLIKETKDNTVTVKPKIVVSVTYQNIQRSPSYGSGYALRFPRITAYRPDRSVKDIASLEDIEREVKRTERK